MTRLKDLGLDATTGRRRWSLHLLPLESRVIRNLPAQLEDLLADPSANRRVIERLFPASYADPAEEAENRRLLSAGLLDERRAMLAAVRSSLAGAQPEKGGLTLALDAVAMDLWLRFFNDVRLVLATDLGIETNLDDVWPLDADDPDAPKYALLEYLGGLESIIVDALAREM